MESKSAELKDSGVDWMHIHETLVSKGLACEGLLNLVSRVAVLKREALLIDAGITFFFYHIPSTIVCIQSAAIELLAGFLVFCLMGVTHLH